MSDRKNILIADDEFNTRTALERFFKRKYAIKTAADGAEALALIEAGEFDLVLTDLRMPGADGMSVLKAASAKKIPCVLLTAYGSINDAVQAVKHTRIPILIIHGEADTFVPCSMSAGIADANPQKVTRYTIPGAEHGISYLVDRASYQKYVTEFLSHISQ